MNRPAASVDRYPPFAADISARVKTIWISAGPGAWDRANHWKADGRPGLVLPPRERASSYTWPVKGFNVALIATDMPDQDVADIVTELMHAGAVVIATLYGPADATKMELIAHGRNV